jgi:hypothetical protein
MPTKCLSLVRGRRIRLTRLDACGRPIYGEDSSVVSKGFISVALTANTIESDEINVTNAAGERCVYEPAEPSLTGYGVEIQFCEVDPDLFSLVTGQPTVLDFDGNSIGFDVDTATSLSGSGFALELWAGSANSDACATEGAQGSFGYLLLPFIKGGIVGDFTVENANITFTITGGSTRDGNAWGVGPYSDIMLDDAVTPAPGPMATSISSTVALRTMLTDVAPPEAACGARPLLDPDAAELTSIAGVATGLSVDFDTTPAASSPVYWDFGDGTWDYVAAPGDATHVYAAAGTYTARASTNGVWRTTNVTVTA